MGHGDGRELSVFHGDVGLGSGAFSKDGRLVLTRGADAVQVWDAASGEPISLIRGHGTGNVPSVTSASLSPDGRIVLTSGLDGTAKVWDAETGEGIAILRRGDDTSNNTSLVEAARFSPGGTLIAVVRGQHADIYRCDECQSLARLRRLADERVSRTLTRSEQARYIRVSAGGA